NGNEVVTIASIPGKTSQPSNLPIGIRHLPLICLTLLLAGQTITCRQGLQGSTGTAMRSLIPRPLFRVLSVGLLLLHFGSHAVASDKTNFIVLLCDDLGYGDLSCFA